MFIMFLLRDKLLSVEDEEGRVPPPHASHVDAPPPPQLLHLLLLLMLPLPRTPRSRSRSVTVVGIDEEKAASK